MLSGIKRNKKQCKAVEHKTLKNRLRQTKCLVREFKRIS